MPGHNKNLYTYESLIQDPLIPFETEQEKAERERQEEEAKKEAYKAFLNSIPGGVGAGMNLVLNAAGRVAQAVKGVTTDLAFAAADTFYGDEKSIEEKEAIANKAINFLGGGIVGKIAGDYGYGPAQALDKIAESKDLLSPDFGIDPETGQEKSFIDLFNEGRYDDAAVALSEDIASGIPDIVAAIYGGAAVLPLLGVSAAGSKYKEIAETKPDATLAQKWGASTVTGGAEFATELITRGIGKRLLTLKNLEKATGIKMPRVSSPVEKVSNVVFGVTGEGTSEALAELSEMTADRYILEDEDAYNGISKRLWRTGIVGGILGGSVTSMQNFRDGKNKTEDATDEQAKKQNFRDLAETILQPEEISNKQKALNQEIIKLQNDLELVDDIETKTAISKQIKQKQESLRKSKEAVSNQFDELSDKDLQDLAKTTNEIDQLDYSINKKETPDLAKQELQKQKDELENQRVMIFTLMMNPNQGKVPKNDVNALLEKYDGDTDKMIIEGLGKTPQGKETFDFVQSEFGQAIGGLTESITKRVYDRIPEDKKKTVTRDSFKSDLITDASVLVTQEFDATKQDLGTFLTNRLNLRANRLAEQLGVSQQDQVDITETAPIEQEQTAIEEAIDNQDAIEQSAIDIGKQIKLPETLTSEISNAARLALMTAKEKGDALKFATDISKTLKDKLYKEVSKFFGKDTKKEAAFTNTLENNAEALYNVLRPEAMAMARDGKKNPFIEAGFLRDGEKVKFESVGKEAFVNYFKGVDIPKRADGTENRSAKANRKIRLAEALAVSLGANEAINLLKNDANLRQSFIEAQQALGLNQSDYIDRITRDANLELQNELGVKSNKDLKVKDYIKTNVVPVLKNNLTPEQKTLLLYSLTGTGKDESNLDYGQRGMIYPSIKEAQKALGLESQVLSKEYEILGKAAKKFGDKAYQNPNQIPLSIIESLKTDKNLLNTISKQNKAKEIIFKDLVKTFANIASSNPNLASGLNHIIGLQSEYQGHFIRSMIPFVSFTEAASLKDGIHDEHYSKAQETAYFVQSIIKKAAADKNYINESLQEDLNKTWKGAGRGIVSKNEGELFNKRKKTGEKKSIDEAPIQEILNTIKNKGAHFLLPNTTLNPTNKVINLIEYLNLNVDGKQTADIKSTQQKAAEQKTGDNVELFIDRVIAKLQNLTGGPGTLQTNIAAIPTSLLIGGLRTVKLAYKGGKALAEAVSEGYKYVKSFISEQEWSDFVEQSTYEVADQKVPAEKQLAILSEKGVREAQEKVRKENENNLAKLGEKTKDQSTDKIISDLKTKKDDKVKEQKEKTSTIGTDALNIFKGKGPTKGSLIRKLNIYVPPGADDFAGLLYTFYKPGKEGEAQMKFFEENIMTPFAKGINAYEAAKVALGKDYKELKKRYKNKGLLKQTILDGQYTNEDAVRAYLFARGDQDLGISESDQEALIATVVNNNDLLAFAEDLSKITKTEKGYTEIYKDWEGGNIDLDLNIANQTQQRKEFLAEFLNNKEQIFSKENMKVIKQLHGEDFTDALSNVLTRMETGVNRKQGKDKEFNSAMNWLNQSVANIMAVNVRSAVLQQLSIVNFMNFTHNNPIAMAKAMGNRQQFTEDFFRLWNSSFLTDRRGGQKIELNTADIADSQPGNWFLRANKKLLELGFKPTQWGDSFAISFGGASWYRNRINQLVNQGIDPAQAEEQTMIEFQEIAEETQQSSRPDRISRQQASDIGRLILAFANTPLQYARLTKKATLDLINRRGDWRTNASKILYYGAAQNIIFSGLQSALFSLLLSDNEDDEKDEKKLGFFANTIFDGFLRGMGYSGAVVAALKNLGQEYYSQQKRKAEGKRVSDPALRLIQKGLTISPPVSKKIGDIIEAQRFENWRQYKEDPFYQYFAKANYVSGLTNVPLDRAFKKVENLRAISIEQNDAWQNIFLALGWSPYQLDVEKNIKEPKTKIKEFKPRKFTPKKFTPVKKIETKDLGKGIMGRANNDGTIEVDKNLSPTQKKKVIAHEQQHQRDMKSGKLNYDDDFVYWKGSKYPRVGGKIEYNNKKYIEGHPKLPWEAAANKVERQVS